MFVLPGAIALIVFFIVRVQEIVPALRGVTMVHLLVAAAIGLAIDIRQGRVRWPRSLFVGPAVGFMMMGSLLYASQIRGSLHSVPILTVALASFGLFWFIALGAQNVQALKILGFSLAACVLFTTVIATHQGTQPTTCMMMTADGLKPLAGPPQECERRRECESNPNAEPDTDFWCERVGLLGTASTNARVRYRGLLEDPNELSWIITAVLPLFMFAIESWPGGTKIPLLVALIALDATCVIMTRSRSGQLSFLLVMFVFMWRRGGKKALILAALMALPVLLLGGRDSEEADASSLERLGCWAAGIKMWTEAPLFGVGPFQFGEHHNLTAHNSFVLTFAEGGPLYLMLFVGMFWGGFRAMSHYARELKDVPGAEKPAQLAVALGVAMAPTALSAFFLSMAYKPALWALFGMLPAYEETVCRHDPSLQIRWRLRDALGIFVFSLCIVVAIYFYTRHKNAW